MCLPEIRRFLIRKLEKRKNYISILINSKIKLKKILALILALMLIIRFKKTYFKLYTLIIIRKYY